VPELQSIRGIAALLVLLGHCCSYYATPDWFHTAEIGAANGEASVVIFFVLSGYVLMNMLARGEISAGSTMEYFVRRGFRIYPALWAASLFALAYVLFLHWQIPVPGTSFWFANVCFKRAHFTAIGIIASFAGALAFLIPPVWSIFVELMGSALLPVLNLCAKRGGVLFGVVGLALFAISFWVGPATYYSVGTYLLDFWLGAALFLVVMRDNKLLTPAPVVRIVATAVALLVIVCGQYLGQSGSDPGVTLAYALAAMVLITGCVKAWSGFGVLKRTWLVTLGDWSYSLYLLHFTVMCCTAKVMQLAGASALDSVWRSLLLGLLTLLITIPLSALSYRFVELQGIALGNRVAAAVGLRRAQAAA